MVESQWMNFEPQPQTGKTTTIRITSKMRGDVLGTIRWYGAWRQYAFFPAAGTIFNTGCMEDIQAQIRELMETRRDLG